MSIEVGSKLQGKVTGITHFGAFVELAEGATGLVHISEVADRYVKDIHEHLKVGDAVEVKVMNVEKDGKIGLSIKQAKDRPESEQKLTYTPRPRQNRGTNRAKDIFRPKETFETKMAQFLKDSEDRLSTLKKSTETKRGGRGGRRG